jgi:hypothetical protein
MAVNAIPWRVRHGNHGNGRGSLQYQYQRRAHFRLLPWQKVTFIRQANLVELKASISPHKKISIFAPALVSLAWTVLVMPLYVTVIS